MKEEKNVISFHTSLNVFYFWLSGGHYSIPEKHHLNMLLGKGCSLKMLKKYFKHGHSFSSSAILHVLQTDPKTAQTLLDNNFFCEHIKRHMIFHDQGIKSIAQLKGVQWMLKNRIELTNSILENFLKKATSKDYKLLIENITCLRNCEELVFNSDNKELIISFLKTYRPKNQHLSLLLRYNDSDIFNTLLDEQIYIPSDFAISIFSSDKLNSVALKFASNRLLDEEEIAYIVDNDRCDLFEAFITEHNDQLSTDSIKYISENASLNMFSILAEKLFIPVYDNNTPVEFYERLLKGVEQNMFKDVIKKLLLPDNIVAQQLENGNEEISEILCDNNYSFSGRSAVSILKSNNTSLIEKMLKQEDGIGYYAESWLFKSGLNQYIKLYLERNPELSDFSKAILFKYTDKQIVLDFITDDSDFSYLQFQAVLERNDEHIIKAMLDTLKNFHEDDEYLSLFMRYAPVHVIENFFNNLEDAEVFTISNSELSKEIFTNREPSVQDIFIKYFTFDDEDTQNMLELADISTIIKNIDLFDFDEDDICIALKRKDPILAKLIIEKFDIDDVDTIKAILTSWDLELVLLYEEKLSYYSDNLYEYLD